MEPASPPVHDRSMTTQGPLTGRIALVTGASRGLGRATAVELAAAGAYVVCTARSTREAATQTEVDDLTVEGTIDAVRAAGGDGEWHRCDHTEPVQVEALLRDVLDRHGRVDMLVNNAWGGHDQHDAPGRRGGVGRVDGAVPGDAPRWRLLRLRDHDAHPPARDGAGPVRARAHHHVAHARAAGVGALRVEQGREEPAGLRPRLPPAGQGHPGHRGRARLDAHRADAHPPHRAGARRQDRDAAPRGPGDGRPRRRSGR